MEGGNPRRKVTLQGGFPFSIVFPGTVCMPGRVTLGGGSPYLLCRVTLLGGLTFYKVKGRVRVKFSTIGLLSHSRHI